MLKIQKVVRPKPYQPDHQRRPWIWKTELTCESLQICNFVDLQQVVYLELWMEYWNTVSYGSNTGKM